MNLKQIKDSDNAQSKLWIELKSSLNKKAKGAWKIEGEGDEIYCTPPSGIKPAQAEAAAQSVSLSQLKYKGKSEGKYIFVKRSEVGDSSEVSELFKLIDSVVGNTPEDRAVLIEKYSTDLFKLIEDSITSASDVIETVDEVVSDDVRSGLMEVISEQFDQPESLDDTLWDYILHQGLDQGEVVKFLTTTDLLTDEDKVIVVDEIL